MALAATGHAPGKREFHFGGELARVEKADIAKVSLADGTFAFQHHDARWFSRAGKYSFQYGAMRNAQVFLLALDQPMGSRRGEGAKPTAPPWVPPPRATFTPPPPPAGTARSSRSGP